jgi:hypothetical protein
MENGEPEFARPCEEATAVEIPGIEEWLGVKLFVWMVDIPDLQALHAFIDKHGDIIIEKKVGWLEDERADALGNPPSLRIYDGYVG